MKVPERIIRFVLLLAALPLTATCIRNDVPLPVVRPAVTSVTAEGVLEVKIDPSSSTVTLILDERADIHSVNVSEVLFNCEVSSVEPPMTGVQDLSEERLFTVTTYQDYKWKLRAVQSVDRRFSVEGQVGESVFDAVNRRIVADVLRNRPLSNLKVSSFRLGPEDLTEYSLDVMSVRNFSSPVKVEVRSHGRSETWSIHVSHTDAAVIFKEISPWTRVCHLAASGLAGNRNSFRYRRVGDEQWTEVPDSAVTVSGGSFRACIDSLEPATEYECVAFSGSHFSSVSSFTTDVEVQLPNAGFEIFSNAESPYYFSFFDPSSAVCGAKWWDSGNPGSTSVGASGVICAPDTDEHMEGSASVRMDSRYVVIKFAAGNIFSGSFAGLVGTSGGKVDFGRPFTHRPRALRLWVKYSGGAVDNVGGYPRDDAVKEGDPDRCAIFCALGDWDYRKYGGTADSPVRVDTTDPSTFFNKDSESVIAYGEFVSTGTDNWQEVEIPLQYSSTSRVPTHIIISCAASRLGDWFTGSSASTLWIDGLRLVY